MNACRKIKKGAVGEKQDWWKVGVYRHAKHFVNGSATCTEWHHLY